MRVRVDSYITNDWHIVYILYTFRRHGWIFGWLEEYKEGRKEGTKMRVGQVRVSSLPESFASFSGKSKGPAARLRSTHLRAPRGAWTLVSDRMGVNFCSALACG